MDRGYFESLYNVSLAAAPLRRCSIVTRHRQPVGALGKPAQRNVVHGVLDGADAAVAEYKLAHARMVAAEALERLANGSGANPHVVEVSDERKRRRRGSRRRRAGRPPEDAGKLAVVDA